MTDHLIGGAMATTRTTIGRRHRGQGDRRDRRGVEPLADVAEESTRRRSGLVGLIVGILLAASTALLVVQNTQSVPLHWLWFDAEAPMWLLLASGLVAGLVAGPPIIAGVRHSRARRRERLDFIERTRGSR